MIDLNYLYFFSNDAIDVFEIKRLDLGPNSSLSEIYKWLVHNKSTKTIEELLFKSMGEVDNYHYRSFLQGNLKFNEHSAEFHLHEQDYKLLNVSKVEVSPTFNAMVTKFLSVKQLTP